MNFQPELLIRRVLDCPKALYKISLWEQKKISNTQIILNIKFFWTQKLFCTEKIFKNIFELEFFEPNFFGTNKHETSSRTCGAVCVPRDETIVFRKKYGGGHKISQENIRI